MKTYEIEQIEQAERGHNWEYKMQIQVVGVANKSKFMSITKEQLDQIKSIFKTTKP